MSFDATWRIALETTAAPGSLNASLVTELSGLDAEAKRLRKIGQNPIDDLRPKVDALRASVSRVRAETIAKGRDRLDQYRPNGALAETRTPPPSSCARTTLVSASPLWTTPGSRR